MTTINFYSDDNFLFLKKRKKVFSILLVTFAFLLAISLSLFIIFSTYYNQKIMMVIGSICSCLIACPLIYSIFRIYDYHRRIDQFSFIQSHKGEEIEGELCSFNSFPLTLADSTKAYEIVVYTDEQKREKRIIYLVSMFSFTFLENKKYHFVVVSDYIKEISYED